MKTTINNVNSFNSLATGAFMLSRRAVNSLVDDAIKNNKIYNASKINTPWWAWGDVFDIFRVDVQEKISFGRLVPL